MESSEVVSNHPNTYLAAMQVLPACGFNIRWSRIMRSFDIGTDHLSEPAVSPSHSDDRTFTLREVEVFIEDMRRKITADVHRLIVEGVESFRKEFDSKLAQLEMEQKEFRRILGAHAVLDKGQFPHPATISKI